MTQQRFNEMFRSIVAYGWASNAEITALAANATDAQLRALHSYAKLTANRHCTDECAALFHIISHGKLGKICK